MAVAAATRATDTSFGGPSSMAATAGTAEEVVTVVRVATPEAAVLPPIFISTFLSKTNTRSHGLRFLQKEATAAWAVAAAPVR
jgi:hypothetical protein